MLVPKGARRMGGLMASAAVMALLCGCSTLPTNGPSAAAVRAGESAAATALPYRLVPIDARTVGVLSRVDTVSLAQRFKDRRGQPEIKLGVGDVVAVTIYEASPGGLFTPAVSAGARPGNNVDLPVQQIDQTGNIAIPYAGQVRAAGQTIPQIQAAIQDKLKNRAIEPQAVVSLREQHSTVASVLGEVPQAGVMALNPAGERVLEILARAGGSKYPPVETYITLQRGTSKARVRLARIVDDPHENVFVRPGDVLFVSRDVPTFVAIGATGGSNGTTVNGLFPFDNDTLTLAQGLGKAGGLGDSQADPSSVFVYRMESRSVLKSLGYEATGEESPTIYTINLRDPSGLLLAQQFRLRDKDAIFVGNATSVEFLKLINVINTTTAAASNVNATNRGIQAR